MGQQAINMEAAGRREIEKGRESYAFESGPKNSDKFSSGVQ